MTENNAKNKEKKKKQAAQKGIDLVMSRAIEKVLAEDSEGRGERKADKTAPDAAATKTRARRTAAKADAVKP